MSEATTTATDSAQADGRIVVSAHDLSRVYGQGETAVHALGGVTLEVERGKLTAVMGFPGSGKSTLMHLLNKVGPKDRRSHQPSELSGGQQQRVAIARALGSPLTVVFADEADRIIVLDDGEIVTELQGADEQEVLTALEEMTRA